MIITLYKIKNEYNSFLYFLFFLLLTTGCETINKCETCLTQKVTYYGSGDTLALQWFVNNEFHHGVEHFFDSLGNETVSLSYENDKLEGPMIKYNVNSGYPEFCVYYNNGKKNGPSFSFNENGTLKEVFHNNIGFAKGPGIIYNEKGDLSQYCYYGCLIGCVLFKIDYNYDNDSVYGNPIDVFQRIDLQNDTTLFNFYIADPPRYRREVSLVVEHERSLIEIKSLIPLNSANLFEFRVNKNSLLTNNYKLVVKLQSYITDNSYEYSYNFE